MIFDQFTCFTFLIVFLVILVFLTVSLDVLTFFEVSDQFS